MLFSRRYYSVQRTICLSNVIYSVVYIGTAQFSEYYLQKVSAGVIFGNWGDSPVELPLLNCYVYFFNRVFSMTKHSTRLLPSIYQYCFHTKCNKNSTDDTTSSTSNYRFWPFTVGAHTKASIRLKLRTNTSRCTPQTISPSLTFFVNCTVTNQTP